MHDDEIVWDYLKTRPTETLSISDAHIFMVNLVVKYKAPSIIPPINKLCNYNLSKLALNELFSDIKLLANLNRKQVYPDQNWRVSVERLLSSEHNVSNSELLITYFGISFVELVQISLTESDQKLHNFVYVVPLLKSITALFFHQYVVIDILKS
jgi:hypothetical protein